LQLLCQLPFMHKLYFIRLQTFMEWSCWCLLFLCLCLTT
jgi:hypothetical protein